jgi:predicted aminopeptidase
MNWPHLILLMAMFAGSGCQTASYYSQAVIGQGQIICCRKSIKKMVDDPKQPETLVHKLELVLELREYALDELGLDPGGNYLKYKSLDRKFALWVVYAAPEFDVDLKSWWYPVVGRFTSRGWFNESGARRSANELRHQGLDVHVGGAPAYSTLGWFDDPVLSTFIKHSETDLAELIFHELAHRRLFLAGDATFNESFATATARAGVQRWLRAKGKTEAEKRYDAECKRENAFVGLVLKTRSALKDLYQTGRPPETMRKRKALILQELKSQLLALHEEDPEHSGLARWAERPINNANLAAIAVYYRQVPVFERLLKNNDGDLEKYFAEVKSLSKLAKEERIRRMESLVREK